MIVSATTGAVQGATESCGRFRGTARLIDFLKRLGNDGQYVSLGLTGTQLTGNDWARAGACIRELKDDV